jgi:hypothetical protein
MWGRSTFPVDDAAGPQQSAFFPRSNGGASLPPGQPPAHRKGGSAGMSASALEGGVSSRWQALYDGRGTIPDRPQPQPSRDWTTMTGTPVAGLRFPSSRVALWDHTPTGQEAEVAVTVRAPQHRHTGGSQRGANVDWKIACRRIGDDQHSCMRSVEDLFSAYLRVADG